MTIFAIRPPLRRVSVVLIALFGLMSGGGLRTSSAGADPSVNAMRPVHGLAMHGDPALPPDFDHFPYANPQARKGGRLRVGLPGTYDSLNPFNLKSGSAAQGLVGNIFQGLMARSNDEPFTLYPLIARSIEIDPARTHLVFHLDPRAHFSDGRPITAEDVLFSFDLLKNRGRPQQRSAYRLVKSIEAPDPRTVRLDITGAGDRELPVAPDGAPVAERVLKFHQKFLILSAAILSASPIGRLGSEVSRLT